jgi:hypothetical protein
VGGVAIKDGCISSTNLTRLIADDDLSVERSRFFGRVILGIGSNITTMNIFDRDIPK